MNGPAYDSVEYWEKKYKSNDLPFEWLVASHSLEGNIKDILQKSDESRTKILHIGCGTSSMSYTLRSLVEDPSDVHNVDFSKEAIHQGIQMEQVIIKSEKGSEAQHPAIPKVSHNKGNAMRWSHASLLSLDSLLDQCEPSEYSIVVDKSTSDSIACGDDVEIQSPFLITSNALSLEARNRISLNDRTVFRVYPLHILALHLALFTKPGSIWIAVSYSSTRFDFLDPHLEKHDERFLKEELLNHGFPDTRKLWVLEQVSDIETTEHYMEHARPVHRPKVVHFMFILRRTDIPLSIRK
jgi:hypothetical protein